MHQSIRWFNTMLCLMAAGCAHMPDDMLSYRQTSAVVTVTVTQSFGCSSDGKRRSTSVDVGIKPTYGPGPETTVHLSDFGAVWSKTSVGLDLRDDGRLQGFNATGEGQGPAIIKSAVEILASINRVGSPPDLCGEMAKLPPPAKAEGPKTATIVYSLPVVIDDKGVVSVAPNVPEGEFRVLDIKTDHEEGFLLRPDEMANPDAKPLAAVLGQLRLWKSADVVEDRHIESMTTAGTALPAVDCATADVRDGFVRLPLRKTAEITLRVSYKPTLDVPPREWKETTVVPLSTCYAVRVPKGRAFGTSLFELTLTDAGRINHLKYGAGGAAQDAASALGSLVSLRPTDASEAKDDQDKADKIYQRQRLMACSLDASKCTH